MDPPIVDAGTGGEQDLDELHAIEARRQVERTVEVAPALDQQGHAGPVNAERVRQRCAEHVGLRDRAEQRASSAHFHAHQFGVGVE